MYKTHRVLVRPAQIAEFAALIIMDSVILRREVKKEAGHCSSNGRRAKVSCVALRGGGALLLFAL
jgi:hypothetical protein